MTVFEIKDTYRNGILPRHWWQAWLCFVLGKPTSFLITDDDYVLTEAELSCFDDGIAKMLSGVPLAYLMGEQEFFGRIFKVNEHTLIPRPDTERLIEEVLGWAGSHDLQMGKLLDLGTGTGCIAITLAKALPNCQITALDISPDALLVAIENAKNLSVDNCTFLQSNWYENVHEKFDIIVANPPYIAKDDEHLTALMAEPMTALVAEDDGLMDIKHIISGAREHLNAGGLLAIEHGYDQGRKVWAIFDEYGYQSLRSVQDYGGNDRLTMGVYGG
ncbi:MULTISPECIES: peptide chain release factor N(5)-glutamine methyltransferase [unclassified Moraxella]|uniref:peptide chain release factor N(5)-glutamine methyltransferase n=1 Tax=unclassified Moraxella TaxID=2685852 RepID=UPI002B40ACA8|nr:MULTISPECIES: peptide chain release factor N(5)-glutamine methyltransferase [unclassified Moraxella]